MIGEILFYYESRQNPNGDPGFENQPRLMHDDTIMVTDVRIKRTMRDYARDTRNQKLFVDFGDDGKPITADARALEIVGSLDGDIIGDLIDKTFDVPLFGALVTLRDGKSSEKMTGPLQFGISRSVNRVRVINPTIVGRFVGKKKQGDKQFSTFGKFYSVEYALIKVQGTLNPKNLGKYMSDKKEQLDKKAGMIHDCLWNGTNGLVTRSKYPQRSILYIRVNYKSKIYNDLPSLVSESEYLQGQATNLGTDPFDFDKLVRTMEHRRDEIDSIQICGAEDIADQIKKLKSDLESAGVKTELLQN